MFFQMGVLKSFVDFAGKNLCRSLFLIKLQAWRSAPLLKRDTNTGVFPWNLRNFSKHLVLRNTAGCCFRSLLLKLLYEKNRTWTKDLNLLYCYSTERTQKIFSVSSRMLDSLAGCLTELRASDFYWMLFSFRLFFDILASLSIFRMFSRGISGRWKFSCSDIPRTIIKFDYIN